MLLKCFIKNEKWLKFQGPSLELTNRKVLGQGLYFDHNNHAPNLYRKFWQP